ncbi:MAG: ferrochelatase [Defluviitaleaceae bacterium]|nr:ferrochelatase [Defluviitaleaceae bacterium]
MEQPKNGVLLVNIGTPKSTDPEDVKVFLKAFLSDKRVIKSNSLVWKMVLNGLVLRRRPPRAAKRYEAIWTDAGSPILVYAKAQKAHLQGLMPDTIVEIGMSYSEPTIAEGLEKLIAKGVTKLTVIPLFPQYSGTTVGSIFDATCDYFVKTDKVVDIRFATSYHTQPDYIAYFAGKIKTYTDFDAVLFSYHNIPKAYAEAGDRYPHECAETTRLIMEQVGEMPHFQCFQSTFGHDEWLSPKTDETLKVLPEKGIKKLLVVAPGFLADNLETLLEIGVEGRKLFMEAGGEEFVYLPTFNDDPALAGILKNL